MLYQLTLKINPITLTGQVLLNQQPFAAQSPLRICGTHSFFDWYPDLPNLLFSEVNDDYTLTVEGPDLALAILHAVFSAVPQCRSLIRIPRQLHYSMELRYRWLTAAAAKLNISLPKVPRFSIQSGTRDSGTALAASGQLPPFYHSLCANTPMQVNIWLEPPAGQSTPCDLVLVGGSGADTILPGGSPLLHLASSDRTSIITEWVDRMILAPYLFQCRSLLLQGMKKAGFETRAQVQMICRDEPWVELQVPSRMEVGTSAKIQYQKFPTDNLRLTVTDPTVLSVSGSDLLARKPGNTSLIISTENGAELRRSTIQIYKVNRVTSIALQLPNAVFLVNETFAVMPSYTPTNPDNLSQAQWSTAPTGILTHLGNGRFRTASSGKCSITLTVESVSQTINMEVFPTPTLLQLPHNIRVKLNHTPASVHAVLQPSGSRCQTIQYRISDPSIAVWDPGLKAVRPIAEGSTELEAAVIGANGTCLFTQKCPVTVLPEKDIVTLPTMLTLAFCCTVLSFLSYCANSPFYIYLLLASCICSVVSIIQNATACFRRQSTSSQKLILFLSILILLLCVCFPFLIRY